MQLAYEVENFLVAPFLKNKGINEVIFYFTNVSKMFFQHVALALFQAKQPYAVSGYHTEHWRRQWHPSPVLLPGESHGWRSLVGCNLWSCKESDTTQWLHFHFPLSCTGEGNGNPLQCSCLENPRDRGAWWAAVYGVAQSRTWLKWLSSSSSTVHWG